MPGKGSAAKRQRQNEKRRQDNRTVRSRIHTEKRKFIAAVEEKDAQSAEQMFADVVKLIDSAASKGVYQKNTANRKKSRLHKMLNSLERKEA